MIRLFFLSGIYGGANAITKLFGFLVFMYIARNLTVGDFATFGLLYATQQGFISFSNSGIYESIVGFIKGKDSDEERERLLLESNLVFSLLGLLSGLILTLILILTGVANTGFMLAIISGLLLSFALLKSRVVRLKDEHKLSLSYTFLTQSFSFGGGMIWFFMNPGYDSFFLGSILGMSISYILFFVIDKKSYQFVYSPQTKKILLNSLPFILVSVFVWFNSYGNNYLIDLFLEENSIAKFTFLLSLCSILLIIAGSVNQVWNPKFIMLSTQMSLEKLEKINGSFYSLLVVLIAFIAGIIVLIYSELLASLGGNLVQYQNAVIELGLLFVSYVVQIPRWQSENHLMHLGKGRLILTQNIISSIIGIVLTLILMVFIGDLGIYIGFCAKMTTHSILSFFQTKKLVTLNLSFVAIIFAIVILLSALFLESFPLFWKISFYVSISGLIFYFIFWKNLLFMLRSNVFHHAK